MPLSADQIGFADPAGDLAAFALESFDYDTGGGTQAQTAIGLVLPASGGPVPVGASNPLPVAGTGAAGTADAGVLTVQGLAGFGITTNLRYSIMQSISLNSAGDGFRDVGSSLAVLAFNTTYNATSDGIEFTATPIERKQVVGCSLWVCGGYGINNSSGTNTNTIFRACNSFYSCTSGDENGFGDSPNWFPQDEVAQPYTSSTDMTPKSTALAIGAGFAPGVFENETFRSYVSSGAVQPEHESGGGAFVHIIGG